MRALLLLIVLSCAVGCGGSCTRLDASTDAKLKASIACLEKSLPPDEAKRFHKAMTDITAKTIFDLSLGGLDVVQQALRERLDKKTAAEVIADGEAIRAALNAKKAAQ